MQMELIEGPALEPVPAGAFRPPGCGDRDDATLLACLFTAARIVCEARTGLQFMAQRWRLSYGPEEDWHLPVVPLRSVDAVRLVAGGTCFDLDPAAVSLETGGRGPRLKPAGAEHWTVPDGQGCWQVEVTAGLASRPEELPQALGEAVSSLALHWYREREPVGFGDGTVPVPDAVSDLLAAYSPDARGHGRM